MLDQAEYFERWCSWMLLEHGASIESMLPDIWASYAESLPKFRKQNFYFGCGHDAGKAKYLDWDLSDIRDIDGAIKWDILGGFPYSTSVLREVKSKLSLGMFTVDQVKFILSEVARCLQLDGLFTLTFRNFERLLDRRDELDPSLFVRYIYGSGRYYGSRRRSCWTTEWLVDLAKRYGFDELLTSERGMNTTVQLIRVDRKIASFPEPKIHRAADGSIINDGGDFPSDTAV